MGSVCHMQKKMSSNYANLEVCICKPTCVFIALFFIHWQEKQLKL